ncbi:hypothetical protein BpHYR1_038873 [Brachionus plicatilis]|uniref:Secreted protein n=1 Tax=Brachionus plicatilis TaxID=10195 RepID=A0A3M7R5X5_BRAPC|nr:hypothetical protein BpHYR1_038873 [Brachionus plicatilis]
MSILSLIKILLLTATHSFISSPSGSITASLRLPLPNVVEACFTRSKLCDSPASETFFFDLKVIFFMFKVQKFDELPRNFFNNLTKNIS